MNSSVSSAAGTGKNRDRVESVVGQGSTFRVQLPLGNAHLRPHQIIEKDLDASPAPADRNQLICALCASEPGRRVPAAAGACGGAMAGLALAAAGLGKLGAAPRAELLRNVAGYEEALARRGRQLGEAGDEAPYESGAD